METKEEALPTIVAPGPELREKVDHFAARLSTLEKPKADEMVAKVLASSKRNQFLFIDSSHIFYPYFLSKLTEYRNHPELRPDKKASESAAATGTAAPAPSSSSSSTASTTTTTKTGSIVRTVGGTATSKSDPKREEMLRQAEQEARRYLHDPFPNQYSLDLKGGSVDMPALLMDMLSCTAQYTAKYGDSFLHAVQGKLKQNPAFRFLQSDDIRHDVFKQLVASYKRILNFDEEETEARLERMQSKEYVLGTVIDEKTKYAKAALARRKAALLTDDQLRARLQWGSFKVLRSFTLSDLLLDGPVPDTALSRRHLQPPTPPSTDHQYAEADEEVDPTAPTSVAPPTADAPTTLVPPGGAPSFAPVFMSSSLVKSTAANTKSANVVKRPGGAGRGRGGGGGGAHHRSDNVTAAAAVEVEENYTPQVVAPTRRGVEFFVDAETGQRLRAEDLQTAKSAEGGEATAVTPGTKRDRSEDLGLASEDEVAREMRRRAKENA